MGLGIQCAAWAVAYSRCSVGVSCVKEWSSLLTGSRTVERAQSTPLEGHQSNTIAGTQVVATPS